MSLQPLRIPTGWKVQWNMFDEADPIFFTEEDSSYRLHFSEDLLQLQKGNVIVDLGWYPEGKVVGNYLLILVKDKKWSEPVYSFESRDKEIVIKEIEKLLQKA